MPWPLKDAGGRLVAGERASLPDAPGWGEKYEGEVAADDESRALVAVGVRDGVEGLVVARRRRGESAAELLV
jgi:hypothetical protein